MAWEMTCALYREITPILNNAMVPGSLTVRSCARSSRPSTAYRDSPRAGASSARVNSSHASGMPAGPCGVQPDAGRRRISSATAVCFSADAAASLRSAAQTIPSSSSSLTPPNRSSSPAAQSA